MATNPRSSATATRSRPKAAKPDAKAGEDGEKAATTTAKASKYHPCKCLHGTGKQCPDETTRAFARGHDARIASRLAQDVATGSTTMADAKKVLSEAGGTDLLLSKMEHSADLRQSKTNEASKAAADKKAAKAKAAEDSDKAEAPAQGKNPVGQEVQIQHDKRKVRGVVVRNSAGELVARHRHQGANCDHELEV